MNFVNLHVVQDTKFPFNILITTEDGVTVKNYSRAAYSFHDNSIEDVMSGVNFGIDASKEVAAANAEQLAYAQLEAAGPEMLAALKKVARVLRNVLAENDTQFDALQSVYDAIAKAEGNSK